ncbi:PKD domain-containing protein [Candidatus Parcubacteria bacterium]|nr:PKD domain-containing protein [Candidatus Parcubacteria bacterium]
MRGIFIGSLFFLLPIAVQAAVTFSEVAWMGDTTSANHEWIELYNDEALVDVTGWTVNDGMNLNISLSGEIPANTAVVLERTSDDSASGTAFLIYTGALVNTGATLQLLRADGAVEDQVSGGSNWQEIGGDNLTKETAQYTSGGWVTAAATPGRLITATEVPVAAANPTPMPTTNTKTTSGSVKKITASEPIVLKLRDASLQLSVTAQKIGYVHQPITMDVKPSGIGDTLLDSLQYEWNFGDGEIATTKKTTHVYEYPGTYVVTVYGGFKRQAQVARHEITILPVTLSLTTNQAGDVQINNDSPYELDLSGYRLVGEREFTFAPRTIILPNQTITIPREWVDAGSERMVAIYDTKTALLASVLPQRLLAVTYEVPTPAPASYSNVLSLTSPPFSASTDKGNFGFGESKKEIVSEDVITPMVAVAEAAETPVLSGDIPSQNSDQRWTYYALAGVIFLGTIGIFVSPRRNETL